MLPFVLVELLSHLGSGTHMSPMLTHQHLLLSSLADAANLPYATETTNRALPSQKRPR